MTEPALIALARAQTRLVLLEEALADYVRRYGLTEQARAVFCDNIQCAAPVPASDGARETAAAEGCSPAGFMPSSSL